MSDLTAFVTARLDEDEHVAKMAAEDAFGASANWHVDTTYENSGHAGVRGENGEMEAEHIARHDPARVLREVMAKRKIVDHHRPVRDHEGIAVCGSCLGSVVRWPCPTLYHLAAIWRDHPDYDPAWAKW